MSLLIDNAVISMCAGLAAWAVFSLVRDCNANNQKRMEEIRLAQASLDSKVQALRDSLAEWIERPQQRHSCWMAVFKGVKTGRIYIKSADGNLDATQAEWDCRKEAQGEMDKLEDMETLWLEYMVWPEQ